MHGWKDADADADAADGADGHALHREWARIGVERDRTWVVLEKETGWAKQTCKSSTIPKTF